MKKKKQILKVLIGSRAHGLATEESDWDYRGVYIEPTSEILKLRYKYKGKHWCEGEEKDNTSYEIGHFLKLATYSNPSILEVFKAPWIEITKEGKELRRLFKHVWEPQRAFDAFTGYGFNQRKKMLKNKDGRASKYAVAYIRVLLQLRELLEYKDFTVDLKKNKAIFEHGDIGSVEAVKYSLMEFKKGNFSPGEVIDWAESLIEDCEKYLKKCDQEQDLKKVNEFLLKVRKNNWEIS